MFWTVRGANAILALNRLEYYECYAAAEVGGFIFAPVNFRLAPPEIVYMLRDSAARILIFEAQFAPVIDELRGELGGVERFVCIGEGCPAWAVSFESVVAEGAPQGPPITPRADDYVYLWYTSGTTGKPKGVPWRQEAAVLSAQMNAAATEYTGLTRMLQVTPLFHIGGKGYAAGATWAGGRTDFHSVDRSAIGRGQIRSGRLSEACSLLVQEVDGHHRSFPGVAFGGLHRKLQNLH